MKQVNIKMPLRMLGLLLGLFLSVGAFAQINVKGHVKDSQGEPIIGATVRIVGQSTGGAISDFDGNFTLQVKQGAQLSISYVGYQTQTVTAAANLSPVVDFADLDGNLLIANDRFTGMTVENGKITDACFDGVACTISTSSTDIMCDLLRGKEINEGRKIIDAFFKMMHEEEFDAELLDEAIVFINTSKQAARIRCATIGWNAAEEILKDK